MVFYSKGKGIFFSENISCITALNDAVYISVCGENAMYKIKEFDSMEHAENYVKDLATKIGLYSNPNTVINIDTLTRVM